MVNHKYFIKHLIFVIWYYILFWHVHNFLNLESNKTINIKSVLLATVPLPFLFPSYPKEQQNNSTLVRDCNFSVFRAVSTSCMFLRLYAVIKTAFLKHFTKSHPLQASEESMNLLSQLWQLSHQNFGTQLQFQETAVLPFMTACNFNFWNRVTWNPCSVNMNILPGGSIHMLRSVGVVSFTLIRLYKC